MTVLEDSLKPKLHLNILINIPAVSILTIDATKINCLSAVGSILRFVFPKVILVILEGENTWQYLRKAINSHSK